MRSVTTKFNEISVFAEKSGKCEICKKSCKRREKFYQTLNPFNKNKNGKPKSHSEIMAEINGTVEEWKLKPLRHSKCENPA